MEIDWITVAAQIVNFLVLVWLLHRFLYGPITRAMKRREDRIADRLRQADEKRKEAESEGEKLRKERNDLERRSDELLDEARRKAAEERKSLEEEARADIEARRAEWRKQLEEEQSTFLNDLRRMATDEFYALNKRALKDLADAELESQFANAFVGRLKELDKPLRDRLVKACRESDSAVTVTSRFELPANDRRQITKAIHDEISDDADVTYRQDEDTGCGIELRTGSQTVSWSLESYFDGLRDTLAEAIERQTRRKEEGPQGDAEENGNDGPEESSNGGEKPGKTEAEEAKSENRQAQP